MAKNYSAIYKQKAKDWKKYAEGLENIVDNCLEDLRNISQKRVVLPENSSYSATDQFADYASRKLKSKVNFKALKPRTDFRKGI